MSVNNAQRQTRKAVKGLLVVIGRAIAGLFIIGVLFMLVITGIFWFSAKDNVEGTLRPLRIRGVAVGKGLEENSCFGWILYDEGRAVDTLRHVYSCASRENDIWHYLGPGDSIIKDPGTMEVLVKRKDTLTKFIFPVRRLM